MGKITKIEYILFALLLSILYLPIFFLIFFSFSASDVPGIWTYFSTKWYKEIFANVDLLKAAAASVKVAVVSATCSTILGIMAAIATCSKNIFPGRKLLNTCMSLPLVTPEIIIGFSILMLFIAAEKTFNISIERGIMAISIGHIIASISYVHILVRTRIIACDPSIEEAAINLGAKPLKILFSITLPQIKSSIISSWLFAFAISFDDLVIASFLSGPGSTTLPVLIFSNIRVGLSPVINAFSSMIICSVILFAIIMYTVSLRKKL